MEVVELAERLGVVDKSGSWLSYAGEQLGQGRDQAEKRLRADPALHETLANAVREALVARRAVGAAAAEAA